jgi:hypothetical protein
MKIFMPGRSRRGRQEARIRNLGYKSGYKSCFRPLPPNKKALANEAQAFDFFDGKVGSGRGTRYHIQKDDNSPDFQWLAWIGVAEIRVLHPAGM